MNDSIKLRAPKPIKSSSNYNGIRYNFNHEFEKINTEFNSLTPKIRKINNHCPPRISSFTSYGKQFMSQCAFKFDESTFEKTVEKDFQMLKINDDDSLSKSEILSILKSDSFLYEQQRYSHDDEDNYFDDIKTSLPPRTSNPLYRHLDSTASVEYKTNNEISDESFFKLKEMNFEEKIND